MAGLREPPLAGIAMVLQVGLVERCGSCGVEDNVARALETLGPAGLKGRDVGRSEADGGLLREWLWMLGSSERRRDVRHGTGCLWRN